MTLKENLINNFLKDERRNFTIYQTNFNELSDLYEKVVNCVRKKENFKRFLIWEKVLTGDGKVKADKLVTFFDKEQKREKKLPVVFKYSVYNYFYSEYCAAIMEIAEKRKVEPLPEPPQGLPDPHWAI